MNALWVKAEEKHLLQTVYAVLRIELAKSERDKKNEQKKFIEKANDQQALAKYIRDTGFNQDTCERVLSDIIADKEYIDGLNHEIPGNAIMGDIALTQLYPGVWNNSSGQKPTDLIVLDPQDPIAALGDCKFGMISVDSGLLTDSSRLQGDFIDKCIAVADFVRQQDGVQCNEKIFFIVTTNLAPLLRNRVDDFKEDPHYSSIPLDNIVFCSVSDIVMKLKDVLPCEG